MVAVGAGVGVPLGVLCLSLLALFLLERRKIRSIYLKDSNNRSKTLGMIPSAAGQDLQHEGQVKLAEDQAKHEMGGDTARSELANNSIAHQAR